MGLGRTTYILNIIFILFILFVCLFGREKVSCRGANKGFELTLKKKKRLDFISEYVECHTS